MSWIRRAILAQYSPTTLAYLGYYGECLILRGVWWPSWFGGESPLYLRSSSGKQMLRAFFSCVSVFAKMLEFVDLPVIVKPTNITPCLGPEHKGWAAANKEKLPRHAAPGALRVMHNHENVSQSSLTSIR